MSVVPLCVIAAGGTGGHMFPAQALAEKLLDRGWRVKLSTDERGRRYAGGFPDAVEIEEVRSATFARGGVVAKLMVPFRIGLGVLASVRAMRRDRPSVVVGFGGYPSVPALLAAIILRRPRMIHEQNGVLGRVNRVLARRVHRFACGTWPTALPKGVEGIHTGNPVREEVLKRAGAPYIPPGDHPMSVLVFGGSQGARIISDKVPVSLGALPAEVRARVRVSHQAREEDHDRVVADYEAAGIRADIRPFFDDLPTRMAEAQLVICRSGASSIADLTVIGRPSILIPYAAATGDHQTANASGMGSGGASIVIAERDLMPTGLQNAIADILGNTDKAAKMAQAALALGKPGAADDLADMVENLKEEA